MRNRGLTRRSELARLRRELAAINTVIARLEALTALRATES